MTLRSPQEAKPLSGEGWVELLTAEQMRQADRAAIEGMKIPGLKLMEKAGEAVAKEAARILKSFLPPASSGRIAVLCGKGNNGGDGLVAARLLKRRGHPVIVFLTASDFSKDAAVQFNRLPRGIPVLRVHTAAAWDRENEKIKSCALVIDALFGTGLSHALKDHARRIVEDVNRMTKPVLAVDIPSGVDATTGAILGAAVAAHTTVTFARPKIGHILFPGAECAGRLVVSDIGIPDEAVRAAHPDTFLLDARVAAGLVPPRLDHSHKGTFGRSVILAGSRGMVGAAVLAAEAALRIGSGLTLLCVPDSIYPIAAKKLPPEAMCQPIPDAGRGAFGPESLKPLAPFLERASSILIGPGIGRHPATIRWVQALMKQASGKQKWIVDAHAISPAAVAPPPRRGRPGGGARPMHDIAVTPHAGEMSKLIGRTRGWVESRFCSVARDYSKNQGMTVVLKGSRTAVAAPDGSVFLNATGNAALAKGATGDVLAGLICGLAAQGLSTFDAARLAVYLHGRSAEIAVARGRDKRTFIASDIFTYLDPALRELSKFLNRK